MPKPTTSMQARLAVGGFTLIEFMVVVSVVGILAAVALPTFQEYTIRARVVEAFALAAPAKTVVADNLASGTPALGHGYRAPSSTGHVASVTIDDARGQITIALTDRAGGGTILITPSVRGAPIAPGIVPSTPIAWDCRSGTLPTMYRPAECR